MSKVILENTEKEISGFYYDIQRKNPMMRVTLHANTKPPSNPFAPWPSWCEGGGTSSRGDKDKSFLYYNYNKPDIDEPEAEEVIDFVIDGNSEKIDIRYGALPIATSIINEDFNVSIANSWTDYMGGQGLNDLFNSFKSFEPYAHEVAPILKTIGSEFKDYIDKNEGSMFSNKVGKTASNLLDSMGNLMGKKGNTLSRSLVAQGTRFKYYSGTGIAFSNLGMRFTLFADYVELLDENSDGSIKYTGTYKFMAPDDQLKMLLKYSIGEYTNFLQEGTLKDISNKVVYETTDENGNTKAIRLKDALNYIPGMSDKSIEESEGIINTYLGWQMSPGGFRANVKYIDSVQTGTLMLKIGPYYRLKNLIIQDVQLNYSKHIAKYFDNDTKSIKTCPLYCDVFVNFTPANKYSDRMLKEFVLCRARSSGNNTPKSIESLEKTINSNLFK